MTRSNTVTRNYDYVRLLHALVFAVAMLSISLHGPIAQAAIVGTSNHQQFVSDTNWEQPGRTRAALNKRPPRRFRFRHPDATPIEYGIRKEQHYEH